MDVEHYRQILAQCFPDLAVSSIEFVGGGSFRVFEVNENLIFRFPHGFDSRDLLHQERRAYDCLQPLLPLPIPRYQFFSDGCPLFNQPVAGYRKLPGVALEHCSFDRATLRSIATQIGKFLSELHSISPSAVREARIPTKPLRQSREQLSAFYTKVQQLVFPRLNAQERAWAKNLFESFLADFANWHYPLVLVHGDFDASNILCEPDRGRVVGIIDFEDACLSDPAVDFCVLLAEFGSEFLGDVLAAYRVPRDEGFEQRVASHARRVLFVELLYGIEEKTQVFIDNGLKRLRRAMAGQEPIGGWLAVSTAETRSAAGFPP
jgi:aminoglycoside 2''-phosphotransferase